MTPGAITPGARDPDRAERRRRREALRRAHPDLGGDPAEFARLVRSLGASRAAPPGPADEVRFVRRPHGLARLPAWWRARRHPRPRRVV